MIKRIVTKDMWSNLQPPSKKKKRKTIQYRLSEEERKNLDRGLLPLQMECHWFVYFEDNKLYFYRSWTGYLAYIMEFYNDNIEITVFTEVINSTSDECFQNAVNLFESYIKRKNPKGFNGDEYLDCVFGGWFEEDDYLLRFF